MLAKLQTFSLLGIDALPVDDRGRRRPQSANIVASCTPSVCSPIWPILIGYIPSKRKSLLLPPSRIMLSLAYSNSSRRAGRQRHAVVALFERAYNDQRIGTYKVTDNQYTA